MNSFTTVRARFSAFMERRYGSTLFSSSQIFKMLLPLIVDQFFIYLIGMLTNAMISTSSQESVTAVGMVFPVTMVLMSLFTAVGSGGTILVAQYVGKGDTDKSAKAAAQLVSMSIIVASAIAVVLVIFAHPLVNLLFPKAEEIIRAKAATYITGICISYIPFAVYNGIFSALRGYGETKVCLRLTIIINAIHLCCSFLFINILQMDVVGTTLSYILARVIGGVCALYAVLGTKHRLSFKIKDLLTINSAMVKNIVKLGIPFAIEQIFINSGAVIAQMFISTLGTISMAANTISASVSNLFYGMGFAVSALAVTVVGQSMGAGDVELAKRYSKRMVELGFIISILSLIVIYPLMPFILQLYHPEADTLPLINQLILIGAVPLPLFWSLSYILPANFRAAGDANFTSVISLITMWVCRVFLSYMLTIVFKFGVYGVWISIGAEWALRSLFFGIRWRGKKWFSKKIV